LPSSTCKEEEGVNLMLQRRGLKQRAHR
jgi:hypothetical protein